MALILLCILAPAAFCGTAAPVIDMVQIKGACFDMGDTFGDGLENERPVKRVCVGDFSLGKYVVTQAQWEAVMGDNPSYSQKGGDYPVEYVTWDEVHEFILKLNKMTGKHYRLPTEAEWEYAARSGGRKEKWAGTSDESKLGDYAWYEKNSGDKIHPVGTRKPNGLGLYDMTGNVWQWTQGFYSDTWYDQMHARENPRPIRGGDWGDHATYVRTTRRTGVGRSMRMISVGFRLATGTER